MIPQSIFYFGVFGIQTEKSLSVVNIFSLFFGLSNKNPLDLLLLCKDTFKGKKTFVTVHHKTSLLNKVPQVP